MNSKKRISVSAGVSPSVGMWNDNFMHVCV